MNSDRARAQDTPTWFFYEGTLLPTFPRVLSSPAGPLRGCDSPRKFSCVPSPFPTSSRVSLSFPAVQDAPSPATPREGLSDSLTTGNVFPFLRWDPDSASPAQTPQGSYRVAVRVSIHSIYTSLNKSLFPKVQCASVSPLSSKPSLTIL